MLFLAMQLFFSSPLYYGLGGIIYSQQLAEWQQMKNSPFETTFIFAFHKPRSQKWGSRRDKGDERGWDFDPQFAAPFSSSATPCRLFFLFFFANLRGDDCSRLRIIRSSR